MRVSGKRLRRVGAAAVVLLLAACGDRGAGPAPVVLAVPPEGGYRAMPPSTWASPPAPHYAAGPPPVERSYAPTPVARAPIEHRPVAVAALPPPGPPAPSRPLHATQPPRALAQRHPPPRDAEAMAEVKADVARAAAADAAQNRQPSQPERAGERERPRRTETASRETAARPQPPARAAAANNEARFVWPVRGRVLAHFGNGPGGAHNDGINIAAPQGAPIEATAAGTVAYAGNELRGYGNLILIKHPHGWISAYAHCDVILVKKGQMVARGQVIGRVGATGSVKEPQLHFELRRGDKPVDPLDYLGAPATANAAQRDRDG